MVGEREMWSLECECTDSRRPEGKKHVADFKKHGARERVVKVQTSAIYLPSSC
jgi:hypothetical protein